MNKLLLLTTLIFMSTCYAQVTLETRDNLKFKIIAYNYIIDNPEDYSLQLALCTVTGKNVTEIEIEDLCRFIEYQLTLTSTDTNGTK